MRKLSRNEWIAVSLAIIFVGYTLFGGDIIKIFQGNSMTDQLASALNPGQKGNKVIINDIVVGQGPEAKAGETLTVHYILSLSDGTVVQNSKDFGQPFQFVLGAGDVIPGWGMAFEGMKVGGVRTVIIPPELAYGSNQVGPIPPNSTLVFTIELLDAVPAAQVAQ